VLFRSGGVITVGIALYSSLRKAAKDYFDADADGVWTEQEKITLADNIIQSIIEAKNFISAFKNLISVIRSRNNKTK
jgi:hypothetical protein